MNKRLITRLLGVVLAFAFLGTRFSAFAQTEVPTPDTVYHDCFGCDSYLLTANNTVYYSDTVIAIPHRVVAPSIIYIDVVNIYQITIGQSYDVRDTAQQSVCRNKLPYAYHGNFYTESGEYWVDFPSVQGCDSAHTLLQLQVLSGQHDTVDLALCYGQSSVSYEDLNFTAPGCYTFDIGTDTNGCPVDVTYRITQYPLVSDTMHLTLCSNELPYYFMGQRVDSAGVYDIRYINSIGCEAIIYLNLMVNPAQTTTQTVNATVCASELPYVIHGRSYNGPAAETFTIPNQYGCDSLKVSLTLAVTYPFTDTVTHYLCAEEFPYMYDSVHTFTEPGQYYINDSTNSTTCISFTLLRLFQYPSVHDTLTICTADSSYTFGDTTFTASTVYTYTDTNAYQCLDYHTLRVNILQQMGYDTLDVSVCASNMPYHFMGVTYTAAGDYPLILQNQEGCDSVTLLLRLAVQQNPQVVTSKSVTRNEIPYVFRGESYSQSGIYTEVVPAATSAECDTSYILVLNVIPIYTVEFDTTVCANTPVVFLGDTITTAGAHTYTYHLNGYDSVITLNVHHNPIYRAETFYAEVGEYDLPYHFVDSAYYTAGYHEQILSTVDGCDSVLSVFLTINSAIVNMDTINKEICSNDLPLTLYDSILTHAGVYRYIVPSSTPAVDSVFFVNLTVKESPTLIIADTTYLCAGGTVTLTAQSTGSVYLWNNGSTESSISVSLAGQYSVTVSNAFDCSTSATVQVIGVALPDARINGRTTVCEGNSLTLVAIGGTEYLWSEGTVSDTLVVTPTESTTYWVTVSNAYGCSRTKDVAVTVNPLPELTIFGNNSICEGQSTTFTVMGAESYRWSNGGRLDRITVNTEGVYTVTATDNNQCQNTASVTLTVHPLPTLKINGRATFCQGGTTTVTATGASDYEWSSGEVTQSITASYAGTYTVTGTDQYGCSSSRSVTITQATVNANISGNRYLCHGQSTTLTVSGDNTNTYQWFDGSTNNSIDISNAGLYSVTVTNAIGCQNVLSATVTEYNLTAPVISGELTICEGQSTTLRASGGTSYVWDDGTTQPLITVNATGTYSVTSTNSYGCTATTSATVLVNPAPVVTILAQDAICRGEDISISAITSANTFHWNTGQNTATINVTPTMNTNYTVLVTDEHGCSATASTLVNVNSLPSVYISGTSAVCQGDTATLTATGGVTYLWNTGQYTPTLNVTSSGTYSVVATGSNGCTATAQATVTVHPLPVATVTETAEICRGQQTILMTDAPAGCTYLWSNGSRQSRITVSEAGDYQVTVTNANQCSRSYNSTVTVNDLPQISISGNTEICDGQSTTLTVSGDNVTEYLWSNGDNNASTTVNTAGQYSVLATNQYGCTATASRGVTVHALPEPQISGDLTICLGESTTLTATGGVSYAWSTGESSSQLTVAPTYNQTYSVTASNAFGCVAGTSATVTVNTLPVITFSGNTSMCAGSTTSIMATGGSNYAWSNGSQTATMTTGNAGLYYVTVTNTQGCSSSDSIAVKVNPNPNVQISGADYICTGNVTNLTASGANSYAWNTEETTPIIAVSPSVTTTYSVTGVDTNGCSSSASKVVNVEVLPTISILGNKTICAGQSTTLTATGGTSYQWSTGGNSNSITVTPTRSQTYVVTVTNALGCSASAEVSVTVNMLPVINFSGVTTICSGNSTTITASGASTYVWSTGDQTASVNVNTQGYYRVTATNEYGCVNTGAVYLTVNDNPNVQITGPNYICTGNVANLAATGAQTYHWSTNESTASIAVAPTTTSTYSVTGYDENGCHTTVSKVVNVEALPVISVAGVKTVCQGQSTTLTAMGGVSYQWSNNVSGSTITVTPTATQSYVVTVTNVMGCTSSLETTVTVHSLPQVSFSGNTTICDGSSTTLTAVGNNNFLWSTGAQTASISVSAAGFYKVTATNSNNCTSSDSIYVTVNPNPQVQISGSNYVCAGSITSLSASGADSYLWNTQEITPAITVYPTSATTYTVTGTDTNGCSSTVSKVVNVEALPVIQVLGSRTLCAGQSTTLTATGGSTYVWSTQDSINSIVVSPTQSQSYVVTVTNAYGCLASSAVTVTVNALPQVTFNGNTTICAGNTTTITALGASTYSWSTGAQTANVNVSQPGVYYVTATNAQNCSKTDSVQVIVNPKPQVQIAGSNHICSGSIATLTASGANSYHWNTEEVSAEISISPSSNTTYTVTGYDTNGCYTTVQKVVNVEDVPVVQILGERTICQGQSSVLTALGGTYYQWSNGSSTQDIAVFPNMTTTYTVTAYNDFGCSATSSAIVNVNMLPSIIFSGNTSICQGQTTTITATGGNTYTWSTGATGNSITVSNPGVYRVNVTNSLNCMRSDSIQVVVWDNPTLSINGASLICAGDTASLMVSGAMTYAWGTGEAGSTIVVMPEQTTTYSVIGYDSNNCSSTVSKVVNVESAPEVYISGELAICHGQSTTLTASEAAAYVWSTGATTPAINVSAQGAYTVTASSVNGCQGMASVTVIDNPIPEFTVHGVSTICDNTTAELSVEGDNTYAWNTGSTDMLITISTGGLYTVTATNSYGCELSSSVYVAQLDAPILSILGVNELCQGDSTMLMAITNAQQYLWSTGDTIQAVTVVPDNSTYSVTVTGENGCSSSVEHQITTLPTYDQLFTSSICEHQSYTGYDFEVPTMDTAGVYHFTRALQTVNGCDSIVTLELTVNPLPRLDTISGMPNITQYGNSFYSVNNPQYVDNYEWRVTNPHWTLTNETYPNVTLNVTENGTGTLYVRGFNNCGNAEISLNLYCNVGIEDYLTQTIVKLYPNPVHQSLYIDMDESAEVAKVALFNEAGRLVYQTDCNDTHIEIDCTRFANGHYTVQFLDKQGRRVESRKIVVKNK